MLYKLYSNTGISEKLTNEWYSTRPDHKCSWEQWLINLDTSIRAAEYTNFCTLIDFETEEQLTWFLIRWS